jgi:hypothetical protein
MSGLGISGASRPTLPAQDRAAPKKSSETTKTSQAEATTPSETQTTNTYKESFVSTVSSSREPPRMSLRAWLRRGATSPFTMFADELDSFREKSTEDVAGDLAVAYLSFSELAQKTGDIDLNGAFDEVGELMRGYEHLRMMRTGDLG